jgi:hypothetical protein
MCHGGGLALWAFAKPNGNRRDEETDGDNKKSVIERHHKRFPGDYRFDRGVSLFERCNRIEAFFDEGLLFEGTRGLRIFILANSCVSTATSHFGTGSRNIQEPMR